MPAKQVITVTKTRTRKKANNASNTKAASAKGGRKRCPKCGRYY